MIFPESLDPWHQIKGSTPGSMHRFGVPSLLCQAHLFHQHFSPMGSLLITLLPYVNTYTFSSSSCANTYTFTAPLAPSNLPRLFICTVQHNLLAITIPFFVLTSKKLYRVALISHLLLRVSTLRETSGHFSYNLSSVQDFLDNISLQSPPCRLQHRIKACTPRTQS